MFPHLFAEAVQELKAHAAAPSGSVTAYAGVEPNRPRDVGGSDVCPQDK